MSLVLLHLPCTNLCPAFPLGTLCCTAGHELKIKTCNKECRPPYIFYELKHLLRGQSCSSNLQIDDPTSIRCQLRKEAIKSKCRGLLGFASRAPSPALASAVAPTLGRPGKFHEGQWGSHSNQTDDKSEQSDSCEAVVSATVWLLSCAELSLGAALGATENHPRSSTRQKSSGVLVHCSESPCDQQRAQKHFLLRRSSLFLWEQAQDCVV